MNQIYFECIQKYHTEMMFFRLALIFHTVRLAKGGLIWLQKNKKIYYCIRISEHHFVANFGSLQIVANPHSMPHCYIFYPSKMKVLFHSIELVEEGGQMRKWSLMCVKRGWVVQPPHPIRNISVTVLPYVTSITLNYIHYFTWRYLHYLTWHYIHCLSPIPQIFPQLPPPPPHVHRYTLPDTDT